MSGTDTQAMVGPRFDIVVDGHGYKLWDGLLQNLPFRYQKAAYSYSKTFIERSNISGSYGDNSQDFWLTFSQNDWSLGEQQRYFRANDATSTRKYWTGTSIDTDTVPGQATIRKTTSTLTFAAAVIATCRAPGTGTNGPIYAVTSTNLYQIDGAGTITDKGAHGAGAPNGPQAVCADSAQNIYIAGATKLRRWDGVSTFSDFSADTDAVALVFTNNILYALTFGLAAASKLKSYNTSGVSSTLYTWKEALGNEVACASWLEAFGGHLLIARTRGEGGGNSELWEYDGSATTKVVAFPSNFTVARLDVVQGITFVSGSFLTGSSPAFESALYSYTSSGALDIVWRARTTSTANATFAMATEFQGGVVFTDEVNGKLMLYDIDLGSVSTLGSFTAGAIAQNGTLTGGQLAVVLTRSSTTGYLYPSATTATTATLTTSLDDFDSSLKKYVKAVKVDFDAATDGDGGSVDIAYQLNSVDGAFTSVQTGAAAGTEYTIGQSCRSISIKVMLNKGTSTSGPVLKRIYVRAVPVQQTFRRCQYVLDLTGAAPGSTAGGSQNPVFLRDGTFLTLNGTQMAANLNAAIMSTTPIQIYDRFGGYLAVAEQGEGITELDEVRPGEFIAQTTWREV